jgi:putative addiction module component (TIGR02574 family)
MTRDEILAAVKAMTPAERYDLIEDIRQILDDVEVSPEWMAEIKRRLDESEQHPEQSRPADEVVEELRQKLRNRRRRRAS